MTILALVFVHASLSASAATILWDDSHDSDGDELTGNTLSFASTIAAAGYTLVELNGVAGAITPAALTGVNAVFLWDAENALTPAEITTLQNFVAGGGGLFIAWDAGTNVATSNSLLAPYGLSISGTAVANPGVTGFVPHPVTAGLTTIETGFGTTVGVTSAAIDLTLGSGGDDILAVSASPYRVVVYGDTGTFNNPGDGATDIARVSNAQLARNIAAFTTAPEPQAMILQAFAGILLASNLRRPKGPAL